MPGYRRPEASASAAAHHDACPSSLARETQVWLFSLAQGIDGPVAGTAAVRGVELHELAAKLPFASEDFGAEPYDIREAADRLAKDAGYSGYDGYLLSDFIKRRDQGINYLLDNFPGGRSAVQEVEIHLDEKRLKATFGDDPYSGLPDVLVVARGSAAATALIADFKSGRSVRKPASENRQIASLIGLVKHNFPAVSQAYAAIITEGETGESVGLARFDANQLLAAEAFIKRVAHQVGGPLRLFLSAGHYDPPTAIDQKIDAVAKPGDHCLDCRGRTCCNKLQEKLVRDYFEKMDRLLPLIPASAPLDPSMNPEKLSDILALSTAVSDIAQLYERIRSDAETMVVQLNAKGIKTPGAEVLSGSARIGLTESEIPKLHATLSPALGGQSLIDFALAVAKPSATAVRTHLSSLLSIPEPKVEDHLDGLLGVDKNPLKKGAASEYVNVTRDLADLLDEKHSALKAAEGAKPALPIAAAPVIHASHAAEAEGPKKPRKRVAPPAPAVVHEPVMSSPARAGVALL